MSNKGVTADSDAPLHFIADEIMSQHRILFQEIDCRLESRCLLIRGKMCSYHALQKSLSIVRQWLSDQAGAAHDPIYIRVLVGPEQTIFEKRYSIQEINDDPKLTKTDNQCSVP